MVAVDTRGADLDQVHELYAVPLRKYLVRFTLGKQDLADELLQETLLRAWRHIDTLPPEPESRRRWLFTVARHLAIDHARSRQVRPVEVTDTDLSHIPGTRDDTETVIAFHTVRWALPQLSDEHRAVLVELYYRGSSTSEASARLGVPEGTVKSRAHYALRALRTLIES